MATMTSLIACFVFLIAADGGLAYRFKLGRCNNVAQNCRLNCPDGRMLINGCYVCACKSSLCDRKQCARGERCVVKAYGIIWNANDQANCVKDPYYVPNTTRIIPNKPEDLLNRIFETRCNQNGICNANQRCPDLHTCRYDGRCCRDDPFPTEPPAGLNRCLQEPQVGSCKSLGNQYVYDRTTGKCRKIFYSGCVMSKNSFNDMNTCNNQCVNTCLVRKDAGCDQNIPRYYYNKQQQRCMEYDRRGCSNGENNFDSIDTCEQHCRSLAQFRNDLTPTTTKRPDVKDRDGKSGKLTRKELFQIRLRNLRKSRLQDRGLEVDPIRRPNDGPFPHIPAGAPNGRSSSKSKSYKDSLDALKRHT